MEGKGQSGVKDNSQTSSMNNWVLGHAFIEDGPEGVKTWENVSLGHVKCEMPVKCPHGGVRKVDVQVCPSWDGTGLEK